MAVTLGEALLSAIAKGMIGLGEGSGGTLPDAGKDAGTCQAPASDYREVVPTSSGEQAAPVNLGNAKGRPVHHKAPPQRRTGQPLTLYVIVNNGDRPGRREETAPGRSIAQARGGNLASNSLRLVR